MEDEDAIKTAGQAESVFLSLRYKMEDESDKSLVVLKFISKDYLRKNEQY